MSSTNLHDATETGHPAGIREHVAIPTNLLGEVLIVDDNIYNQNLLSRVIHKTGLSVTITQNGAKAIQFASTTPFDMIFMDLRMPLLDGYEATRQLRANGFIRPIIAVSANNAEADFRLAKESGCDDFVTKPVCIDDIYALIRRHFSEPAYQRHKSMTQQSDIGLDDEYELLVHRFVANLPSQVRLLEQAIANEDWSKVKEITHSLKGTATSFGHPKITQLASVMNDAYHNKEFVSECCYQLDQYCKPIFSNAKN